MAKERLLVTQFPNWFDSSGRVETFNTNLHKYYGSSTAKFLQIGAYTGDATLWLLDNVLFNSTSELTDVDTWEGSDEPTHKEMNWQSVEECYDERTADARKRGRVRKIKGTSDEFFKANTEFYDFIYIDGDHTAYGVLKDAINAYEHLKVGGVLAFDDYEWSAGLGEINEPKIAIDAFECIYQDRIIPVSKGYQAWYQKTR